MAEHGQFDGLARRVDGLPELAQAALDADPAADIRQLIAVDPDGRTFAFTGSETPSWSGHLEGEGFACAGNILTGPEVLFGLARAFATSSGELADRLLLLAME